MLSISPHGVVVETISRITECVTNKEEGLVII